MDPTDQGKVRLSLYSAGGGELSANQCFNGFISIQTLHLDKEGDCSEKILCRRTSLGTTTVEGKGLSKPLGVTFDERMGDWIVANACNDRIVLIPLGCASRVKTTATGGSCTRQLCLSSNRGKCGCLTAIDIRLVAHGDRS